MLTPLLLFHTSQHLESFTLSKNWQQTLSSHFRVFVMVGFPNPLMGLAPSLTLSQRLTTCPSPLYKCFMLESLSSNWLGNLSPLKSVMNATLTAGSTESGDRSLFSPTSCRTRGLHTDLHAPGQWKSQSHWSKMIGLNSMIWAAFYRDQRGGVQWVSTYC